MGCVASKKTLTASPAYDSAGASRELDGSVGILSNSLWARAREDAERSSESGESAGKAGSSRRATSPGFRLGNLHKYIEGEQVAAGWPSWLSAVAKEAIQGLVPLRAESYEKLGKIGQGTYSSVFRARDRDTGKVVALKKVRFYNFEPESVRFMAKEILILRRLDHPNVMKLDGLITSRLSASIYFVFEYMEHDLAGLSSHPNIKFTESQVKCYMHQLMSGLEHCHARGIMHRDIKCANLLVNNEGVLKIADFGLANFFNPGNKQPLTSRVVTLWYRPPELLLGSTDYETTVDLWSVGCVFAEMFTKKPILQGRTEVEQIHKIFKLCGSPPEQYWKRSKLPHATLFKPQQNYESCLWETFKCLPENAFSLLETFLSVEPYKRGTASTALTSEYFKTKPYACELSSLPKYPANKEIDAKSREDLHRKRIIGRSYGQDETRRPSRVYRTRQSNGSSKLASCPEELQLKSHVFHQITVKQNLPELNDDARLLVEFQQLPEGNPFDENQELKQLSQVQLHQSGTVEVPASSGFAWLKRQKEDRPYIRSSNRSSSRGRASGVVEPLSVLLVNSNYDFNRKANGDGMHEAHAGYKGHKPYDVKKGIMLKQWGQSEHPGSFVASGMYHSEDFSEVIYERDAVQPKHCSLGFQDKGDKVEFSQPVMHQSHKFDELLEKHESRIRQAVNRTWFQRGKN